VFSCNQSLESGPRPSGEFKAGFRSLKYISFLISRKNFQPSEKVFRPRERANGFYFNFLCGPFLPSRIWNPAPSLIRALAVNPLSCLGDNGDQQAGHAGPGPPQTRQVRTEDFLKSDYPAMSFYVVFTSLFLTWGTAIFTLINLSPAALHNVPYLQKSCPFSLSAGFLVSGIACTGI
jgi:hypothetical protein